MFIDDYGERVKIEICNKLWQKQEDKKFENLNAAWLYVKDKLDEGLVKLYVKRNKKGAKIQVAKIYQNPGKNTYMYVIDGRGTECDSKEEVYKYLIKQMFSS